MTRRTTARMPIPALLLALSAIPLLGGIARFVSLAGPGTAENARFAGSPVPVVLHIASAMIYSVLGAFQFSPGLRLRAPAWHRRAGRLVALSGLVAGLTGLWMTLFYRIPDDLQGPLLYAVRLAVGSAMIFAIVVAVLSILRRQVVRHEAWMIRAYALGQGAGTQAVVILPFVVLFGDVVGLTRDLLMVLAWVINLVVAEWLILRRSAESRTLRTQPTRAVPHA